MRHSILFLTLCFCFSMTAQEVQLSWNKDYYVASALAKAESKPMLVYFSKSDCKPCLKFYTDFFKKDAFKGIANDFVLVMLDGSNNDINDRDIEVMKLRRLVMHFNKEQTFPAVRALDSNGQELGVMFTSLEESEMTSYINYLQTIK